MKGPLNELEFIEPERYELHEGPFYHFQISRREFVAALGVGIVISVAVPSALGQRAGRGGGGGAGSSLAQRLHIGQLCQEICSLSERKFTNTCPGNRSIRRRVENLRGTRRSNELSNF